MAPLAEGFPEHISEKANQNMGLYAVLKMVPDRAQSQIAFVDTKGSLGLGQLHVSTPQFFAAPIGDVATQQITAFAQPGPITPIVSLAPLQVSAAPSIGFDVHAK